MPSLYDHLNASAHLDADTAWGWDSNPDIPLLGREELTSWLAEDPARTSAILLPV